MSIVSAATILRKARNGRYAVGAFNVTSILQMEAVVEAAIEKGAPLIIQTSVAPSRFIGPRVFAAVYRAVAEEAPVPICLHLDHCSDVDWCKRCADEGYTNIMIDASRLPYDENVAAVREVVRYVHALGDVTVEGELGTVGRVGEDNPAGHGRSTLCDPERSLDFVTNTGVDLFAPAIGTAHGIYKTAEPAVDFDRFTRIRENLENAGVDTPLVIHGGTGLSEAYVRRLVALGGAKFNVSTDLKRCRLDSNRGWIASHPDVYDPGAMDRAERQATVELVGTWIDLLGSTGQARTETA